MTGQTRSIVTIGSWLLICVGSIYGFQEYKNQAGLIGSDFSDSEGVIKGPFHILMFIHPKCPCSVASLNALELIIRSCHSQPSAEVIVVGADESQIASNAFALVAKARAIPDAIVRSELLNEAKLYGARTSGHLVVLNADKQELFRGGITPARGHEGQSVGMECVKSLLTGYAPAERTRPVYGCPLF